MEKRIAKVNISSAGGTASYNSTTYKITLPSSWIKKIGLNQNDREVNLSFDGSEIKITRHLCGKDFVNQKKALGHKLSRLSFYNGNQLCTTIYADFTDETLTIENHISNPIKTAFGNNIYPNWEDFQIFLQERCISKNRAGLQEYMDTLNISEYEPLEIIKQTEGRMAEDQQWLKLEDLS